MKRRIILCVVCSFSFFGCATPKPLVADPGVLDAHPKPLTVYEIGYWNTDYMVVNLIDGRGVHFTVRVHRDDHLALGSVYQK